MPPISDITFLGKRDDYHSERALRFARRLVPTVHSEMAAWNTPYPLLPGGDILLSYMGRWIIRSSDLERYRLAINFHPGTPDYPGFACASFAIYREATEYGVTCHFLTTEVDGGPIIDVRRFPILASETAVSLLERTYDHQIVMFYDIMNRICSNQELVPSEAEHWTRRAYSRADFRELSSIDSAIGENEFEKKVRATTFGTYRPSISVFGRRFELLVGEEGREDQSRD